MRRHSKRIIPLTVLTTYLICTIRMIIYDFYQYYHDINSLKLKNYLGHHSTNLTTVDDVKIKQLRANVNYSLSVLKMLGAPYLNGPFLIISCSVLLAIVISFFSYTQASIYFNYVEPVDLYFVRIVLDRETERVYCNKLIAKQLERFKNSARNYLQSMVAMKSLMLYDSIEEEKEDDNQHEGNMHEGVITSYNQTEHAFTQPTGCMMLWSYDQCNEMTELIREFELTQTQLDSLYHENLLYPINRSYKWIGQTSTQFCTFCVTNILYSLVFDITMVLLVPNYLMHLKMGTNFMNLVTLCEFMIHCGISVLSLTFYWSLFVASSGDQLRFFNHIQKVFVDCRKDNILKYNQIFAATMRPQDKVSVRTNVLSLTLRNPLNALNRNLLFAWMRYKIFLAQLEPVQRSFQYIASNAVAVMFAMPILMRLHLPYLDKEYRLMATYMGFVGLVFADNLLIPMCEFHYRGLKLYKSLYSLAAHSIECMEQTSLGNVYDKHLIWLICKETHQPEILTDRFPTRTFGTPITYPNLVQIHYWFSIIIFSCFFEIPSWREFVGKRLDDPFGFYT